MGASEILLFVAACCCVAPSQAGRWSGGEDGHWNWTSSCSTRDLENSEWPVEAAAVINMGGCKVVSGGIASNIGAFCDVRAENVAMIKTAAPGFTGLIEDYCCESCKVCKSYSEEGDVDLPCYSSATVQSCENKSPEGADLFEGLDCAAYEADYALGARPDNPALLAMADRAGTSRDGVSTMCDAAAGDGDASNRCCVCGGGSCTAWPANRDADSLAAPCPAYAPPTQHQACGDLGGWSSASAGGFGCERTYAADFAEFCESNKDEASADGVKLSEACCMCGGGSRETMPPSPSPTPGTAGREPTADPGDGGDDGGAGDPPLKSGRCVSDYALEFELCSRTNMPESIWVGEGPTQLEWEKTIQGAANMLTVGSLKCREMITSLMCLQAFPPCLKLTPEGLATPQLICQSHCQAISEECSDVFEMAKMAGLLEATVQCDVSFPVTNLAGYERGYWESMKGMPVFPPDGMYTLASGEYPCSATPGETAWSRVGDKWVEKSFNATNSDSECPEVAECLEPLVGKMSVDPDTGCEFAECIVPCPFPVFSESTYSAFWGISTFAGLATVPLNAVVFTPTGIKRYRGGAPLVLVSAALVIAQAVLGDLVSAIGKFDLSCAVASEDEGATLTNTVYESPACLLNKCVVHILQSILFATAASTFTVMKAMTSVNKAKKRKRESDKYKQYAIYAFIIGAPLILCIFTLTLGGRSHYKDELYAANQMRYAFKCGPRFGDIGVCTDSAGKIIHTWRDEVISTQMECEAGGGKTFVVSMSALTQELLIVHVPILVAGAFTSVVALYTGYIAFFWAIGASRARGKNDVVNFNDKQNKLALTLLGVAKRLAVFGVFCTLFLVIYSASTLSFLSTMRTFSVEMDQWTECVLTGFDTACYEASDKSMTGALACRRERSDLILMNRSFSCRPGIPMLFGILFGVPVLLAKKKKKTVVKQAPSVVSSVGGAVRDEGTWGTGASRLGASMVNSNVQTSAVSSRGTINSGSTAMSSSATTADDAALQTTMADGESGLSSEDD